jgi:hypothetical protein
MALYLGKLGAKLEAAGKVRLFAMVDAWTQWALRPLHLLIFSVLRRIPSDCTFDQVGKVEAVFNRVRERGYRVAKCYSFDLSSATDRIPVLVQKLALEPLLGVHKAQAWSDILTMREYLIPGTAKKFSKEKLPRSVRYATGQPMGALSSWAMLAVIHHVIVQMAWYRVCTASGVQYSWTDEYAVLGDDIVIFNPRLAKEYFNLMTRVLGVKIGLAKSLQSQTRYVFEFAKKLWVDGARAFMFPIRDILVAQLSTAVMSEFIAKNDITLDHYLRIRGLGHKARDKVRSSNL